MRRLLALRGVTHQVLSEIDLYIEQKERIALIGHNGSGKSTLLKLIDEQMPPMQGSVEVASKSYLLGQKPQDNTFCSLSVAENCRLFGGVQLEELKAFHPQLAFRKDLPVGLLSGGERQALALALLMGAGSELILLDEHTSALDPRAQKELMRITREQVEKRGVTAIMCTHNLAHAAALATRIVVLEQGRIVADQKGSFTEDELQKFFHRRDLAAP